MALETGDYISDLVITNPVGATDPKSQGDDHLRLIKKALKQTFPNLSGAMSLTQGNLNALAPFFTDPNADRIAFWDDSAGAFAFLAPDGTSIAISGTTLAAGANVPLLNAANTFTAAQRVDVADATAGLKVIGATNGGMRIRTYVDATNGTMLEAVNAAEGAYIKATIAADVLRVTTTATGGLADFVLNGVAASDFARQSQANTFAGQQRIQGGELTALIVDKASSTVGRFKFFVGSGSAYTTDENYIQSLNTALHFLAGASGTTDVFTIGSTGDFDFKAGTVTTNNAAASEVGFKGMPAASDETPVLTDAGKVIIAGGNVTIPANSSVAYPVGTVLSVINNTGSSITIAVTSDSMIFAADGTTGSRTLAGRGIATLIKSASTTWYITGTGLS